MLRLPISHYCHKVDWAFRDHGVEADQCVVWFQDMRDITRINPENTVPVLELEDRLICGSSNILEWLSNESETGHTLYPDDAARKWEAWADETIGPLARRDAYRTLYERPLCYSRNPGFWLAGILGKQIILGVMKAYKARRYYDSDDLERPTILAKIGDKLRSSAGPYLFGQHKTAADYATAALLEPMLRIRSPSQANPDWELLKQYLKRVKPSGSPYQHKEKFSPAVRARLEQKAG